MSISNQERRDEINQERRDEINRLYDDDDDEVVEIEEIIWKNETYYLAEERKQIYTIDFMNQYIQTEGDVDDTKKEWTILYNERKEHLRIKYLNNKYKEIIKKWKLDYPKIIKKDAVKFISKIFLECKYNPEYKYCRDRMNNLYDIEYDEDYVEGEKIFIKNLIKN